MCLSAVLLRRVRLSTVLSNLLAARICRPVPQKSSLPLSVTSTFFFYLNVRKIRPTPADQHAEYQRLLSQYNIKQSMSRKGNCMDNGAMENFSSDLRPKCSMVNILIQLMTSSTVSRSTFITATMKELFLVKMSPMQYRTHSLES